MLYGIGRTPGVDVCPMRVLEVIEATITGTKRHMLDLVAGFQQREDLTVEVACPLARDEHHGDTSFVSEVRALNIPLHAVPMRRRVDPASDLGALARLARIIRRGRYDLVHLHSSKAGGIGRPAAWLAYPDAPSRRPGVVYSPHGFAFLAPGRSSLTASYLIAERLLGRFTDRLIAMSEEEASIALRHKVVSADRVRVVRNGVAADRMPSPVAAESKRRELGWGARGTSVVIGTVAKMNVQKDPFTWLQAVARIAKDRPDLRFVWVMGGELEADVRALARKLGLERNGQLQFFGHRPDAREIIGAMDVFSLSSIFEAGLPYVLMEAMLQERPIVVTAASGSRELTRDGVNSLVVPCGDAEALAAGMLRLANEPGLRSRLGLAGRQAVLDLCTTRRQVEETTRIDRELLAERGTPAIGRSREEYARL